MPPSGGVVGRDAPLRLGDEEVSASHFRVGVAADGAVTVADAGSTNGTVIAGHAVYDERRLMPGELIWAGRSALTVAQAPAADAALSPGGGGYVRFTRSPRLAKRPSAGRVTIPEPPSEPDSARFPVLAIAAPVLLGLLMAILLKQLAYLAFIALSPVMLIGNAISDRRHGRRGHQQRLADYERHRDEAMAALARSRREELAYQRQVHPDPATLLLIASAPSRRLWERHPGDEDFLALRVGTGTVPTLPAEPEWPPRDPGTAGDQLSDAPAVLHLAECGAVGIAGPRDRAAALARGMLLSLAVLHSPREVTVTVLTGPQAARDWDWVRWLPHAREPDSADCVVRMGNDPESVKLRVDELTAALAARLPDPSHGRPPPVPACCDVVILDGAHQFRVDARIAALLQHGPAAGMYFLCLDEDVARLPPECRRAVVELSDDNRATLAHMRGPRYAATDITADVVSPRVCEAGARAMAPLRESGEATADSLPASLRFLDLAGLEPPSAAQIRARWAAGGRTTRALLGSKADGPFVLDLAHGPHLLVAGTTGSGKSELLQTLVASLAVGNRPDAMNFVLVDYKGGAAFQACAPLPHTVGVVTDLDEFEVDRALTSLRAELQRRKAVLSKAGKSNVELYWEVLSADLAADPLPRLVIVVDEFAVMAEQQPDQLRSLVDIGMQGRSLGIHLILATQRPAGVVTADLRANINLRIALRVASPDDSRDVIETVAAASIPATGCAGRAYAWLGGGRPVLFQAARVGGLRPGARPDRGAADVIPFGWAELGRPLGRPEEPRPDPAEPTDLSTLVTAIRAAAEGQIPPQASPWRPPLPSELPAGQVPVLAASDADLARPGPLQLVFGLADEPRRQRQVPAVFDLERGGHLLVAGAPQSGRTTLLRTLAGRLAGQASPDDAHLYVFDGVIADSRGRAIALRVECALRFVDFALHLFQLRVIRSKHRRELRALRVQVGKPQGELLQFVVFEYGRKRAVVSRFDQAEKRFFLVAVRLGFRKLLLQLTQSRVHDVFRGSFFAFEEQQAVIPRISLHFILGFLEFPFDAHELLRKPFGGFLRRVPAEFQVLVDVVRRDPVHNPRRQNRVLRFKGHFHQAALLYRIDAQAVGKGFQRVVDCFRIGARRRRISSGRDRGGLQRRQRPPVTRRVEFGQLIEMQLAYDAPQDAFALQHFVLRLEEGVRHVVDLE